ncbi:hypothetical protein H4R18_005352 [Coemansia javaensis]|uniref:Fork-head domain-containing protein n=1 Tax=Coemansia javaensis TaxID=2761396 RepID=A0A9W8H5A6_9FUNG|nr:hypothetical protein H4R18_005352 [Coemansia javaensis]
MDNPIAVPVPAGTADKAVLGAARHMTEAEPQRAFSSSPAPTRKRRRPPYSYTALIAQAILLSEHKQLTLREIYDSINRMYPQICQGPDVGWQNTIRHNLSLNQCFKRIPRQQLPISLSSKLRGKGSYWTVDVSLMDANTRRRLEEAVSATPAEMRARCGPPGQDAGRRAPRVHDASYSVRDGPDTPRGADAGPFAYSAAGYREPSAAAHGGDVRCVSPTVQSSALYFQSAMHSPIANVSGHAVKHFARPPLQRQTAARQPYLLPPPRLQYLAAPGRYYTRPQGSDLSMAFSVPASTAAAPVSAAGGSGYAPSAPFSDSRHMSTMPIPVSPYIYGGAVSCSRSTARTSASGRDADDGSWGRASLASSSTMGSRQASPYPPSPASPDTQAQEPRSSTPDRSAAGDSSASSDVRDSEKLKITHIIN